ncbi:PepSY domain-containing protein [Buchananella hordeovulneris]|uniref:PepSY domain-containing protein n=1 Tax=Buchananella hordeovulneris TaxID=52770 RepID=UPI0026DDADEF|nr:PepSY domain-containing protein [Buchananella hordeovulneris]MDO5080142.1 PepSY domain-containing protein [Buchananella hordeovulneris]
MKKTVKLLAMAAALPLLFAACSQQADGGAPTALETPLDNAPASQAATAPAPQSSAPAEQSAAPSQAPAPAATSAAPQSAAPSGNSGPLDSALAALTAAETAHGGFQAYELDYDDGRWEVSLVNQDKATKDVHVDLNGTVAHTEDDSELLDQHEDGQFRAATVTLADALRASGVSQVDDVDLAMVNGTLVWKIDVIDDAEVYYVDAKTGQLTK